jgi:hypothetical protein
VLAKKATTPVRSRTKRRWITNTRMIGKKISRTWRCGAAGTQEDEIDPQRGPTTLRTAAPA